VVGASGAPPTASGRSTRRAAAPHRPPPLPWPPHQHGAVAAVVVVVVVQDVLDGLAHRGVVALGGGLWVGSAGLCQWECETGARGGGTLGGHCPYFRERANPDRADRMPLGGSRPVARSLHRGAPAPPFSDPPRGAHRDAAGRAAACRVKHAVDVGVVAAARGGRGQQEAAHAAALARGREGV
jgi:hypothetical protein